LELIKHAELASFTHRAGGPRDGVNLDRPMCRERKP
jgi:hypothetical protein